MIKKLRSNYNLRSVIKISFSHLLSKIYLPRKHGRHILIGVITLALVVGVFSVFSSKSVEAAPWATVMDGFLKRKQLTLVNTTGQQLEANTTYTVTVDTKALYDAGDVQSGCQDVRVVYQPNSTTAKQLGHYFDTASGTTCATSTATKIYFPLQADMSTGASTTYYYLYYKNTAAQDASSVSAFNVGAKQALMHCGFNGDTTCINGDGTEAPTTESGAIRYGGGKSAMSFDGRDDTVNVGYKSEINGATIFTIEAWVYLSNKPNNGGNPSYWLFGNEGGARGFALFISDGAFCSAGKLGLMVSNGSSWPSVCSSSTVTREAWHHLVGTYDGTNASIFIDGNLENSTPLTLMASSNSNFIGTMGGSSERAFGGYIDELRFSNTARYTSNFTPSTSPFIPDEYTKLLLHFDENGEVPYGTSLAMDASGNGNHGTITGAKYVAGLVGVDSSVSDAGYLSNQSYSSHSGIFIEEGTVNKITNPGFDHSTYNTNWGAPSVFDYDATADTFTPSMAKRNSAGPFAAGVMVGGKYDSALENRDNISFSASQISGKFRNTIDYDQGSLVFWITPEWNGNDGKDHIILDTGWGGYFTVFKGASGILAVDRSGQAGVVSTSVSSWQAGQTYSVVVRWDTKNTLGGTNYASISVDDIHTFGQTSSFDFNDSSSIEVGGRGVYSPANAIIEGLTIYRRPLFDGTYGIDVGNGDEINQIYNSGTGKDPTLVTGSWDVVFALPTNASTGALTTGTGNAWSHPHASNLLYTDTTNTGGFMMNGDAYTDGWAPWFLAGGAPKPIVAYQPVGASSLSASYTNLLSPGIKDASLGVAPSWDAGNGWTFNGSTQYLSTGWNWSGPNDTILTKFTNSANTGIIIGATDGGAAAAKIQAHDSGIFLIYNSWALYFPSFSTSAVLGYSNRDVYKDGVLVGSGAAQNSGSFTWPMTIGANNDNGSISSYWGGKMQAVAIYETTLTSTQAIALSNAMSSLSSSTPPPALTPPNSITALSASEKVFAGGYKFTSTGANQGISRSFTATSGGDYVLRALGHSDGTCSPQVKITRADGTTEISHLNGTTTSTRTDPDVYIFTWESPAAEANQIQLINTASSGTCYWHQVEVLSNNFNNPSFESGSGDPWIPVGWNVGTDGPNSPGESIQGTDANSGSSSFEYVNAGGGCCTQIWQSGIVPIVGGYYALGGFTKQTSGTSIPKLVPYNQQPNLYYQSSTSTFDAFTGTTTIWKNQSGVARVNVAVWNSAMGIWSPGTLNARIDDVYAFQLSDVSLTVTPASEANSTESTGLRVDGTDTLTQTIDTITSTGGSIKFKFTPRHSFATADLFGVTQPAIATFYGDADDYIKLYRESDTVLRLRGVFNGTTVNADYSTPTLNAGTTYELKIAYTNGGNLILYVDGTSRATASGVVAFGTTPTTAYFGSDNSGANQYDATFTEPAFASTPTATENTTAPYYKFGSKSAKLVASADGQYVTSINPGNTNTHTLSAYVYDGTSGNVGGTVSATVAKLVFNGDVVTPAYTDMGGGWWRLTYSAVTVNAAGDYGVAVLSGKTIYVDGVQLEEKSIGYGPGQTSHTSYADGSLGTNYSWSGTAHESTSIRTAERLHYATTSNLNLNAGTLSMWVKPGQHSWIKSHQIFTTTGVSLGAYAGVSFPGVYFSAYNGGAFTGGNSNCGGNWDGNLGKWVHMVFTWNGTALECFMNGSSGGAATRTSPTDTITTLSIGGNLNTDADSNSTFSDVRTYSSALSSSEVADLYYSGLGTHQEQVQSSERFTGSGEPPVLNWKMTEGYGTTAYDSSIFQNNGTISGAVWDNTIAPPSSSGEYKSLKFDGSNDFVSRTYTNDTELNPKTDDFTVGVWFRHSSAVSSIQYLLSRYNTSGYKMYMNSSGYICFGIDDDSTWGPDDAACTTTSYADSQWHYAQATKTSSSITLYIDGVQQAQDASLLATGSLSGSNATFYVGIDSDGVSSPWAGHIAGVRVYRASRDSDAVKRDFVSKGNLNDIGTEIGGNNPGGGGVSEADLSRGLVGYWPMDESAWTNDCSTLTVTDASGNGNHGKSCPSSTGPTGAGQGKFGNAGSFDGSNDNVQMTSLGISGTSNFSISGWIKVGSQRTSFDVPLWNGIDSTTAGFGVGYRKPNSMQIHAGWGSSTGEVSGPTAVVGSWYHVASTYDGGTHKFYVDGISQNSISFSSSNFTSGTFNVGSLNNAGYYSNDIIDEVRIYNRALSADEVRALYNFAPGPRVYLKMDEGTGVSAQDSSGNSRTGTLNGGATWDIGKFGKGVRLNGSSQSITIPDF